jgi:hypothetical protein
MDKKIMLFMAVWQRPEITLKVFDHIKELQKLYNIDVFVAYSEMYWVEILRKYKFKGCGVSNRPLGLKFNRAMQRCMEYDFDYLMQCGSDDFINPELFEYYDWGIPAWDVFGVNHCYAYDMASDQFGYVQSNDVAIGAGRVFKRKVLEQLSDNIIIPYVSVKFLRSGMSYGYGYGKGDEGIISADQLPKLLKKEVVKRINDYNSWVNTRVMTRRAFQILYPDHEEIPYSNYNHFFLWPDDAERGLDTRSQRHLENNGILVRVFNTDHPFIVDIKGDHDNLNAFELFSEVKDGAYKHDFLKKIREKMIRGVGVRKFKASEP